MSVQVSALNGRSRSWHCVPPLDSYGFFTAGATPPTSHRNRRCWSSDLTPVDWVPRARHILPKHPGRIGLESQCRCDTSWRRNKSLLIILRHLYGERRVSIFNYNSKITSSQHNINRILPHSPTPNKANLKSLLPTITITMKHNANGSNKAQHILIFTRCYGCWFPTRAESLFVYKICRRRRHK